MHRKICPGVENFNHVNQCSSRNIAEFQLQVSPRNETAVLIFAKLKRSTGTTIVGFYSRLCSNNFHQHPYFTPAIESPRENCSREPKSSLPAVIATMRRHASAARKLIGGTRLKATSWVAASHFY